MPTIDFSTAPGPTVCHAGYSACGPGSETPQAATVAVATAGALRHVWECRYGPMLIEVVGDAIFVNGKIVEPHVG